MRHAFSTANEAAPRGPSRAWGRGVALLLMAALVAGTARAQSAASVDVTLVRRDYVDGDKVLKAFAPVSAATRHSIVKLNVDGATVALGMVVDTNGLVLTKASEIKPGKLTCWLAGGREVSARLIRADTDTDLALVRVAAPDLKPITWATGEVAVGQWAITPGIEETPHAVGIVSSPPRKIRPARALIGVQFDLYTTEPRIVLVLHGFGAQQAGLKPGDVIVAVNDVTFTNREQVVEKLRDYGAGQTVKLGVRRGEEKLDASVSLQAPEAYELGRESITEERFNRPAGEVSQRANGFELAIQHDTVLQPWLCGGPLVNLDGQAVGINIARAGRVATYALPPAVVRRVLTRLEHPGEASPPSAN